MANQPQPRKPSEHKRKIPKTFGRYEIVNEVGRGATAFVYKAYDPELDRYLAIKVLRQEMAQDKKYRESFLREARLAAQLTHPGIVTIFDVGIASDKPYIAMELLEGATLDIILKKQGKLNLKTVLSIALQLCSALNYAHNQGLSHRDIKPANIVILKDKKTVKLTDFGIAQLEDSRLNQEKADKVVGTPEYMAPEQVLGKAMDNRTDLYSFGVLIYRMLMGKVPFSGKSVGDLFKLIVKAKTPQLNFEAGEVEDDLQDLVRKLMHKKPAKRFQKAAEITAELKSIQEKLNRKDIQKAKRFVSLPMRWTAIMAGVVFLSTCISLIIVYFVQNSALSGITYDYGRSIARLLAVDSAESILLDDMVGLNAMVSESLQNEQLEKIYVIDNQNIVLASTNKEEIGKKFIAPPERELLASADGADIFERQISKDKILFDISMPIVFSGKVLGKLYVSYSANSMFAASKTTLIAMLSVMMITLFVVFVITFVLAKKTSQDYKRMTQGIKKLMIGRFDARLISQRDDEAGQLFNAFNQLASVLDNRLGHGKGTQMRPQIDMSETAELEIDDSSIRK